MAIIAYSTAGHRGSRRPVAWSCPIFRARSGSRVQRRVRVQEARTSTTVSNIDDRSPGGGMHDQTVRRNRDRHRTIRTAPRRPIEPRRVKDCHYRTQTDRRNLRQCRLHSDQDARGERESGLHERQAQDFGVVVDGSIAVDMAQVKKRKDSIAGASNKGVTSWIEGMEGVTLIHGHARFVGPKSGPGQWRHAGS